MLKKQAVKGTAVTPDISIPYLSEKFKTAQKITVLNQDNNLSIENIKESHSEKFGFSCFGRPDIVCYLLAYFLGDDTKAGGADPYTHTVIRKEDGRAWLTLQRKIDTSFVQQLQDSKIKSVTFSGNAGKPLKVDVDGVSLGSGTIIGTVEETPSYEIGKPFMFYHGDGRFKFAGGVESLIKEFKIKINIGNEELKNSNMILEDIYETDFDIDVTFDLYADTTKFKNVNYYGTNSVSESVYTASCELDFRYTENVADDRQLKIEIPKVMWKSISGIGLKSKPDYMTESVAGIAEKLATTEIITATCKNSLANDLI